MVKKISYLILSISILAAGSVGIRKLGYWDSSVRVFSYGSDVAFEGRTGRGPGGFEGRGGFRADEGFDNHKGRGGELSSREMGELPDSIRKHFSARRLTPDIEYRNLPDSLKQQSLDRDRERISRNHFEGGYNDGRGRDRGEFNNGNKISFRNVKWFMAVFAMFTVIVIYLDKAVILIRTKRDKAALKKFNSGF